MLIKRQFYEEKEMKEMTKKITLSNINKKIEEQRETFPLTINDEWVIEIQHKFHREGIENVSKNLVQLFEKAGYGLSDEVVAPYLFTLVIKEFTDLGEDIEDDVESIAEVTKKLIELDLFLPIVENLPKEELKRVIDHIEVKAKFINELMDNYDKKMRKHQFKNKEVKNVMTNE